MTAVAMRRRPQAGVGLLEAIVALTLLASAGGALFAWIGQSVRAAVRVEQAQQRAADQLMAQAALQGVNPFLNPRGELQVGTLRISWQAELVAPLRVSLSTEIGQPERWRVGLYRLEVVTRRQDDGTEARFSVTQTGLQLIHPVPVRDREAGVP